MSSARGTAEDVEPFVTTDEVAEFLSVKKSWIYNNHERLKIPSRRVGGLLRWKLSEVESWSTGNRQAELFAEVSAGKSRPRGRGKR